MSSQTDNRRRLGPRDGLIGLVKSTAVVIVQAMTSSVFKLQRNALERGLETLADCLGST